MRAFVLLLVAFSMNIAGVTSARAAGSAPGAATDDATTAALSQTQAMLQDPKAVADYAKTHPDAAKAHANVKTLTGGNAEDTADLYKLAAEIFANVTKDANGNAVDMQTALAAAMKNPQSFASKLTPAQQDQLKALASKIELRNPTSAPH